MARPRRDNRRSNEPKDEFDHQVLDLKRVTRVTKGGKQMSFRACVIVGDRHGRVGQGVAKGKDVQAAVEKATHQAKKHIMRVPLIDGTIPHRVLAKFKAAELLLKPAPRGSGLICGGVVRTVLSLAGVESVSSKVLGSNNKINLAKATLQALGSLKIPRT